MDLPNPICQGCKKESEDPYVRTGGLHHFWQRNDAYGIYTGLYCDGCYGSNDSSKYPYKKDRYFDEAYAGESLYGEEY